MTNAEMKANRYYRWAKARKLVAAIRSHLAQGHTVQLTTYTKVTRYSAKHVDMFKATRSGAYVQSGKSWLCIDGCKVSVFTVS
jgi:riboflavin synthase alpha subunit